MKLLLDHNVSHKLVDQLADLFPGSTQTRLLNFGRSNDPSLWSFAKTHGYVFVTKMATLRSWPFSAAHRRK